MTTRYIKIITLKGSYFTKEYEKKKKDVIKVRKVLEETVKKFFKARDCEVLIILKRQGERFWLLQILQLRISKNISVRNLFHKALISINIDQPHLLIIYS